MRKFVINGRGRDVHMFRVRVEKWQAACVSVRSSGPDSYRDGNCVYVLNVRKLYYQLPSNGTFTKTFKKILVICYKNISLQSNLTKAADVA